MENDFKYRLTVFEDEAFIEGRLGSDLLTVLIKLCKKEGFTHLEPHSEGGFKLIRKN